MMKALVMMAALAAAAAGCGRAGGVAAGERATALADGALAPVDVLIPWGAGDDEVGFRPKGDGTPSQGPWSIAAMPGGGVVVLDALNGKILDVSPDGGVQVVGRVPWHVRGLAAGPDGEVAAWSPVTAQIMLFSNGAPAMMNAARHLVNGRGIDLGPSKTVTLRTAYQERFILGSPSAAVGWPQVLLTKLEGEFPWDEGRGLQVVLDAASRPVLQAVPQRPGQIKASPETLWALDRPVSSARIVGTNETGIVCLETETIVSQIPVGVEKKLVCGRPADGTVLLDLSVPGAGTFSSMNDAALSSEIPVLAVMWPETGGLRVRSFVLGEGVGKEGKP